MNITVIGAGAIGGLLAAKLAAAGQTVSVVARGAQLKAIRERGLVLKEGGEEIVARVDATDRIAEAGRPDLIVLAVKAHQLATIAPDVASILGPSTMVLTAQNGIPWWYFFKHGGPHEGVRLKSVDPGGVIANHLPIDAIIASIVYQAADIESPGVIRHIEGNRFPLAEIDGVKSERVAALSRIFFNAGFKAPVIADVRAEIWTKLWGNLAFNPISALTHATLDGICRFAPTRALAAAMMREAQARRRSARRPLSHFGREAHRRRRKQWARTRPRCCRTSRPAVRSSSRRWSARSSNWPAWPSVATPHLDAVYAVAKLLAETIARGDDRPAAVPT